MKLPVCQPVQQAMTLGVLGGTTLLLTACALTESPVADPRQALGAPPEADIAAIRALAGDFDVSFWFAETDSMVSGYSARGPQQSRASEAVIIVVDEPGRVVLQHVLAQPGGERALKHWRQDWTWEAEERLEFRGNQRWEMTWLHPDQTRGQWTQCVWEVSDAPRYCGTGFWEHSEGRSSWVSDAVLRPLPRREYTTRSDYEVLLVTNHHIVTAEGWVHEQDNFKMQVSGEGAFRPLAREEGRNVYRRIPEHGTLNAAELYWKQTADYWAKVRALWNHAANTGGGLHLRTEIDGMPMIEATFAGAQSVLQAEAHDDEALRSAFEQYVMPFSPDR